MNEHEDTIASSLAQELSDSIDEQFLVDIMYKNYKVVYGPVDWVFTKDKIKSWVKEIMPHCLYHNNTLYYKDEADAIMFRLKWI